MKRYPALILAGSLVAAIAVAQTQTTPTSSSTTPAPTTPAQTPSTKIQIQLTPAPAEPAAPTAPGAKTAKDSKDAKDPKADAKKKDGKADPKKDAKKKKEDEMGKVEGMEIARPNGGFLGVRVIEGVWRLTFYTAKRKPTPPDVARATLRWPVTYKTGDERAVLNPGGDANSLTSPKTVRPPLTFKLFITLLAPGPDGNDIASENYTIDFRQ